MNLSKQQVAVLGCGRSGIAAAKLALQQGASKVCLFDSSAHASCADEGITLIKGATAADARAYAASLIILSPGIEGDSAWVQAFCEQDGALLIGETEFAYHYYHGTIIAITGTNGKTTTTALIEAILNKAGYHAKACGNYGTPLSDIVLSNELCDYAVLEVSSFQMESIVDFKPTLAIWLNFAPDHMDRYKKVEDYYRAKQAIFRNMDSSQLVIARKGEELGAIPCRIQDFCAFEEGAQLSYSDGFIMEEGHQIINLNNTSLQQAHNAENCMAALLACRALGLSDSDISEGIRQFEPPAHRCEKVAEQDGVLWLNDSKSTNLHSTEAALRSQTRPCILILGGKDKGLEYQSLIPLLIEKVTHCICFGQIGKQLVQSLGKSCPCLLAQNVNECVQLAEQHAQAGDVVLFSPATSSFDQFSGYAERGTCYRVAVQRQIKH